MVTRLGILLCLLATLALPPAMADSALEVSVTRADRQWGQPARVFLRYRGPLKLEQIKLDAWKSHAAIVQEDEYLDIDDQSREVQVRVLRLYPRSTGELLLPPLELGNQLSKALALNITNPVVERSELNVNWSINKTTPWQREAIILTVELTTTDHAAHLKLDNLQSDAFIARVIPIETRQRNDQYIHRSGWMIYPLAHGHFSLDLPPLRYVLSGSDRRRFYLPLVKLDVQALPTYMPPTLPIGELNFRSVIDSSDADQGYWQVTATGKALITHGIPGLDMQLARISGRDVADVQMIPGERPDSVHYRLPLPAWLMPVGEELILSSRYFNTTTGKLATEHHVLPRSWRMPTWAWYLFAPITVIFLLVIIQLLLPKIIAWLSQAHLRRQIHQAESAQAIRHLILEHSQTIALAHWAGGTGKRIEVANRLNRLCYSTSQEYDINQLRTMAAACI